MPKKKAVKPSAAARMKSQGKSLVWVTLDDSQKKKIRVAAAAEGLPMSQFLIRAGLTAAEKILAKSSLAG